MVVTVLKRDLDAHTLEEGRVRAEEDAVDAGREVGCQLCDPPVVVGLSGRDEVVLPELDADALRRPAALHVEHVGRE